MRRAERRPGPEKTRTSRTTWIGAAIVGLILAAGVWTLVQQRQAAAAARMPQPPPAAAQSKAIAAHLATRYEAARNEPSSPATVGALCVAYHADMFFDAADRCYARVSELDSSQWRWRYYRALIQAERGGGEALVDNLRRVVNQASDFGPAWQRLGDALFKAGKYDEARDAWERASTAGASDANQPSPALSERRESNGPRHVVEVPLSAYAKVGLARIALVQGDMANAREILERVAADAPQFSSALRLLADVYRSLDRQADADRFVYRANRLQPFAPYLDPMVDDLARESRNSTLLLRVSSEANLAVNAEWAEYLTRRALEFDPDNPEAVVKLGRVLRTIGRNEEALEFFQRYHQMVPGDLLGLAHIGSCLSAMGRYQEAESYLRRAVAGIDDPQTHYNLGLLLSITNRGGEAIAEYEKALARDPMHADARLNMATTLARQGRMDQASRELTRLVEQDPDNAVARTNLGVVLIQQGKVEQARAQLEAAVRSDPGLEPARQALDSISR
jgi:tetratricopeptide (TPR) repeat protein